MGTINRTGKKTHHFISLSNMKSVTLVLCATLASVLLASNQASCYRDVWYDYPEESLTHRRISCPPRCSLSCKFGKVKDSNGCETCDCKPDPNVKCSGVVCARFCEFGKVLDSNGCETCDCKPNPKCSGRLCRRFCEFGFVKNEFGCPICECNDPPTTSTATTTTPTPTTHHADEYYEDGYFDGEHYEYEW